MRQRELEDLDGLLTVEMTLLEYADSVYDHVIITDDAELTQTNIPDWYHIPWVNQFTANNIANVWLVNDPTANAAQINPVTGSVQSLQELTTLGPYAENPQVLFQVVVPSDTVYDTAVVIARGPDGSVYNAVNAGAGNTFTANGIVNVAVDVFNFGTSNVKYDVYFEQSATGLTSNVVTTANIAANVANVINTTKLQDLAVTTAKINDLNVDTVKIANNAVTVPATAISTSSTTLNGLNGSYPTFDNASWVSLLTVDYTIGNVSLTGLNTNIPVLINWAVEALGQNSGTNDRFWRIIRAVGASVTVLYTSSAQGEEFDQFSGGNYVDSINAGTNYTYRLEGAGGSGSAVYNRSITITAVRR